MSDSTTTTQVPVRGGTSLAVLLTVLFVALKLTGVITWSWIWVLSPLWISFIVGVLFMLLFLGCALLVALWSNR